MDPLMMPELRKLRQNNTAIQMTLQESQEWFAGLSRDAKLLTLLSVIPNMTVALRSINHEGDAALTVTSANIMSELNHHLTAKMAAMLEGSSTYPDDQIILGIYNRVGNTDLAPYFGDIWDRAAAFVKSRVVAGM